MAIAPKIEDVISITRNDLTVTEVRDGRVFVRDPSTGGTKSYYLTDVDIKVTKAAPVKPDNWPPKDDDVWQSAVGGRTFHQVAGKLYRTSYGDLSSPHQASTILRDYPDLRLVYRNLG